MITAWKHIPEYQVDEAMLGFDFVGTEDHVEYFCRILESVVDHRVTILNTESYNGARHDHGVGVLVTENEWNEARERHGKAYPKAWEE